ncbi:MAG: 16S rRNA pseudouridine(516) synthase [Ghiorsea sp.]
MRLDKFICNSTAYALADAIAFIENRQVTINGAIATRAADQAHKNNVVTINGEILTPRSSRYFLLHKPMNMICSNVDEAYPSVFNLLDIDRVTELHVAGRLDTDDGHWSFNLTSPKNKCEKMYKVVLSRPISSDAAERFQQGILLQGESRPTLPATLHIVDSYNVLLALTEGRFHQVKRMFSAIGNKVKSLHRQQIGSLELDVEMGHWRSLTSAEVEGLSVSDKCP